MAISAQAPFVSVLVWPVDPEAGNYIQWTLSENYAGCFQVGSDGGADDGAGIPGFQSLQFPNLPALINLQGDIDFVRFTPEGLIQRGPTAALQTKPDDELCGLTIPLHRELLQNRLEKELRQNKAPYLPGTAPQLIWETKEGEWETTIRPRSPFAQTIHTYGLGPDRVAKISTKKPWDANRGFRANWDFGGVIYEHKSDPAVRISWGDKWSLVFRGNGADAHPSLERRQKNGEWGCVRVLREYGPLDEDFWGGSHTVGVIRLGARMSVQVGAFEYGIAETSPDDQSNKPIEATWPSAPLRVSVWGVDVLVSVDRVTGDSPTLDKKGRPVPWGATFTRAVPAPGLPPLGKNQLAFKATGSSVSGDSSSAGARGAVNVRTCLLGTELDRIGISGIWEGNVAVYAVSMQCTSTTAPLLSSFMAEFLPLPTLALPAPIEVRPALSSLSVDTGDPETLPDSEASFSLSHPLLEQLVPDWKNAILPYRPVLIRAKYESDEEWTTLFRGFLTPDSITREGWNDKQLPLVARGPLLRLSEPAALVDERFGALDVQLNGDKTKLWGAEAVQRLLTIELGQGWTYNFNGNGDPMRYLADDHYPLLSKDGDSYFYATNAPRSGAWYLPPPFGSDLKSWLNTLAKYDDAVWFFDAASNAFYYGRIVEMLAERGQTLWSVPETKPSPLTHTTRDWPLLSKLEKSGLLEQAFNDVRVWGGAPKGEEGYSPSFIMGRAGDTDPTSLDPISVAQSWRRTKLEKPDFVKLGIVDTDYANGLAFSIWQQYKGRPPVRMEAEFETGFLGPRWGEILHLPTGFDGPHDAGQAENWRILRVKHAFDFTGSENRFSTTITTRTISAQGQ